MIERVEPHLEGKLVDHIATTKQPVAATKEPAIAVQRTAILRWLLHDLSYITMLLVALVGVILRLPFDYWVIVTPVFGVISTAMGWHRSATREARLDLVWRMALTWCALLAAIFLLFHGSVRGVLNANATALAMLTLLAFGTFIAGVQAKDWRICVVGGILCAAVPGLGWLDQSPLLLAAATVVVIAAGGLAWWASQKRGA
jgi:hypothetical protein